MAPMSPFGNPLFLGFDRLEEVVDRLARSPTDSYPPYNVIHLGNDLQRITLAIAGFEKNIERGKLSNTLAPPNRRSKRRLVSFARRSIKYRVVGLRGMSTI